MTLKRRSRRRGSPVVKQTDPLTLIHADALSSLRTLAGESVQCCVCSPPYWGLRDYGHEQQIGLEKTPEEYVTRLVEVFAELKRVLRNDGTLWLNLGDSYVATKTGDPLSSSTLQGGKANQVACAQRPTKAASNRLKTKDLVGIPWMVAFALRADGWYLRSDIIWNKPNPMPESVTDRPTKSHEYIFLLSKSQKYYYDAEAIKEPATEFNFESRYERPSPKSGPTPERNGIRLRATDKQRGHSRRHAGFNDRWDAMEREQQCSGMRNKRSVWTIATRPFPGAHFATFPPDLVEPCILAGSKPGQAVLDPFAGSGTCAKVAIELGRKAIAIEPKAEYVEMIKRRCQTTIGLPLAI